MKKMIQIINTNKHQINNQQIEIEFLKQKVKEQDHKIEKLEL